MANFLYIFLPIACVLAVNHGGRFLFSERLVSGVALYGLILFFAGAVLGHVNYLKTHIYVSIITIIFLLLSWASWRNRKNIEISFRKRWLRTRRGQFSFGLLLCASLVFFAQIGFDGLYGTRHYDGLWYHIPRVLFWAQNGNFESWATPVWAQIGLPVGANIILGHKILLGEGWNGIGYLTGIFTVGAAVCVYIAALDFRLKKWQALLSAILFFSFPAIGMRLWTVNSDMIAAFPVLAAYIALRRMKDGESAFAIFIVLNGLALACKPTVAPLLFLLGVIGLWRNRQKVIMIRKFSMPCLALFFAFSLVFLSYWPVYQAFNDFQAGDGGRSHKVSNFKEFTSAVTMSAVHWLVEPLGYFHAGGGQGVRGITEPIYEALGGSRVDVDDSWLPSPNQDTGRSGLASLWLLPIPLLGFALPIRCRIVGIFLLASVSLSGMVNFKPWNARYTIILLAGYALIWAGSDLWNRGVRRWFFGWFVCLNLIVLLGVTLVVIYKDRTIHGKPGEYYVPIYPEDRQLILDTLQDKPILFVSQEFPDALLVGTDVDFHYEYLICPEDNDWTKLFLEAAERSNWIAVYHNGERVVVPGPVWQRPGWHTCSEVKMESLGIYLAEAGWRLHKHNKYVDLWFR